MMCVPPQGREVRVYRFRAALASFVLCVALSAATASIVSADGNGNGGNGQNGNGGNGQGRGNYEGNWPPISATPELDSLLLFGSGIAGIAGYVVLRRKARP